MSGMSGFTSKLQDMIARNVESVIAAASEAASEVTGAVTATSPAKKLVRLQREIEEAIIELEGERSRANARKGRLETTLVQNELKEADWEDKAQIAMTNGREDLARQALMARDASLAVVEKARQDLAQTHRELADIEKAMMTLEAQRKDAMERVRAQAEVDAANAQLAGEDPDTSRADALRSKIASLQKRAEFAAEQFMEKHAGGSGASGASVEDEIEEVQSKRRIDIEIEAMKRARGASGSSRED